MTTLAPSTLHLAVALDGAGWHPAAWREPGARPAELFTAALLGRPGRRGRARAARLRHHRGLPRPAVRSPVHGRTHAPTRCGAGSTRCSIAARVAPLTSAHRPGADRGRHPHRAVPPLQGDRHPRLREHRPAGRAGPGLRPVRTRPRTSAAGRSRRGPSLDADGRRSPSCSTRPPTTSRWCAGSGTAGRTTRRSATSPPAGSSTGTSCTTSTSRARSSPSRGPSITPRPPQGQPVVTALAHRTVAVPAARPLAPTSASSPRTTGPTPTRSCGRSAPEQAAAGRADDTVHVFADLVVFLDDGPRRGRRPQGPARRARRRRTPQRRADLRRHARRSWPTCSQEWHGAGLTGFRLRPAGCRARPAADHRRPGARTAAPRRLPHRLRGRHPARAARPAPPRQPLRGRLTGRRARGTR